MGYIIDLCGELTDVPLSFFSGIKIVQHDTIGDTHFIGIRGFKVYGSAYTFSIGDNIWLQVQRDLRDNRIDEIIN